MLRPPNRTSGVVNLGRGYLATLWLTVNELGRMNLNRYIGVAKIAPSQIDYQCRVGRKAATPPVQKRLVIKAGLAAEGKGGVAEFVSDGVDGDGEVAAVAGLGSAVIDLAEQVSLDAALVVEIAHADAC